MLAPSDRIWFVILSEAKNPSGQPSTGALMDTSRGSG
jgi:hypothetical protein